MKKILMTVLFISMTCASHHAFAEFALKHAPVEVDMSVLEQPEEQAPELPPVKLIPPSEITQVPLPPPPKMIKPEPPPKPAPVPAPKPAKKLSKPFFTAEVPKPAPISKPAPQPQPTPATNITEPFAAPVEEPRAEKPAAAVPMHAEMSIIFDQTSSDISPQGQKDLDRLVSQIQDLPDMRIQIRAYATSPDGNQSSARRMSLSRGLMVRTYLIEKGLKPIQLDVRALGTQTETAPPDRVDMVFVR